MDISLRNLPSTLSPLGLKTQLSPPIHALGIQDWSCQKYGKAKSGTLTFLHITDAQRFLIKHGVKAAVVNGALVSRSQLRILDKYVYCEQVRDRAPDGFLLRALEKEALDRLAASKTPPAPKKADVVFAVNRMSCGYYYYDDDGRLVYAPQVSWAMTAGVLKFSRRQVVLTYESEEDEDKMRVELPYRIVESTVLASRPHSLTLTLWEAPRFFRQADEVDQMVGLVLNGPRRQAERIRLTELSGGVGSHRDVLGQCLVYRIEVRPDDFDGKVRALKRNEVLSISHHSGIERVVGKRLVDELGEFRETVKTCAVHVPFTILFQFEALVQNAYLLPSTARTVLLKIAAQRKQGVRHPLPTDPSNVAEQNNLPRSSRQTLCRHALSRRRRRRLNVRPRRNPQIPRPLLETDPRGSNARIHHLPRQNKPRNGLQGPSLSHKHHL